MESVTQIQAYKNLASAILLSAYSEIQKGRFDKAFIESEWCSDICFMCGTVYPKYVKKAYQLVWEHSAKEVDMSFCSRAKPGRHPKGL